MNRVFAIAISGIAAIGLFVSVAGARETPRARAPSTDQNFVKWWRCSCTHLGYFDQSVCQANCAGGICVFSEPGSPLPSCAAGQ
jgi:hypothetical protein